MKTASKFLSMLLLAAMCLSLMGGGAYATGLSLDNSGSLSLALPASDVPSAANGGLSLSAADSSLNTAADSGENLSEGTAVLALDQGSFAISSDIFWIVKSASGAETQCLTLSEAVSAASAGSTVTMQQNYTENEDVIINKNITLDLNNKTLSLGKTISVAANVTLKNGKVYFNGNQINVGDGATLSVSGISCHPAGFATAPTGKVQLYSGTYDVQPNADFLPAGYEYNSTTKQVGPEGSVYVAYVNGQGYETVDEAFNEARKLTGPVVIDISTDTIGNLTADGADFTICDSVTINLNNECLTLTNGLTSSKPITINGYKLTTGENSSITVSAASLTLNANVDSVVAGPGAAVTVNGVTVDEMILLENSTLNMASGTINDLVVEAPDETAPTLNVRGGTITVEDSGIAYGTAVRAIKGGTWYLDDSVLAAFDALVADGYERSGKASPYTVVSKSGTVDPVTDGFTVVGSPYTKGSGSTVYVLMPYTSSNGSYYWSTVSNPTSTSQINTIASGYCSVTSSGSQYKLTLSNSFLDSLSAGTIYLWTGHGGVYTYMGSLTIYGSNNIIPSGDAAVWPVSSTWYSGENLFYFWVTPGLQLVDGSPYDYYEVYIDGMLIGGDKISYNGYQKFGVSSSVMDTLYTGTHSIKVLTTAGYASGTFYVGATLRPVDTDKHVTGSSKNLQFVCSDSISRVWVGGTELTSLNYGDYWTLNSSKKTITLTAKFLNSQLVAGNSYTLTVQTANGDTPSCSFQILTTAQASSSPRTGDESNLALWAAVLVLTGGAAIALLPRLKKNKD